MYKKRNIIFAIIYLLITLAILALFKTLNVLTIILAVAFWLIPTLFSNDFNDKK